MRIFLMRTIVECIVTYIYYAKSKVCVELTVETKLIGTKL